MRHIAHALLSAALWVLVGCDSATETNVMPVPCTMDSQCGGDLRCILPDGGLLDGGAIGTCETR